MKPATFAIVAERAGNAIAILQQANNRVLHENVEAEMDSVVLQSADHLKAGPIADVGKPRITMAAEVSLKDSSVACAIEQCAPGLELANPRRSFFGVKLSHPPIVQILAAAHGVGEVNAPTVAVVDVGHRGGDAAFRHNCVSFAEKRLCNDSDADAGGRSLNRSAQASAASSDDQDIVLMRDVLGH
jgi:hypothetical protein